jgi:signal peptidase II
MLMDVQASDHAPVQSGPSQAVAPMALRCPKAILLFAVCTVVLLVADLSLKAWAFAHVAGAPVVLSRDRPGEPVAYHAPWAVVPSLLSLRLSTNTGAVFGLGKGNQTLLAIISVLATAAIIVVFLRSSGHEWPAHLALALILAGALGNLYDRFRFAAVRDFLWLFPGVKLPFGWTWSGGDGDIYPWIFNVADAGLVVGVILLLTFRWYADRRQRVLQRSSGESSPG